MWPLVPPVKTSKGPLSPGEVPAYLTLNIFYIECANIPHNATQTPDSYNRLFDFYVNCLSVNPVSCTLSSFSGLMLLLLLFTLTAMSIP